LAYKDAKEKFKVATKRCCQHLILVTRRVLTREEEVGQAKDRENPRLKGRKRIT